MIILKRILNKLRSTLNAIRGPVFGEQRFPTAYQKYVGMEAAEFLHDNSKELVEILKDNQVLSGDAKVFELGSGPGRNLHYILNAFPKVKLFCSDLNKEASLAHMSSHVRENVEFFEGDSEDIVKNNVIKDIDLFLISDHLMHLQYEKADEVIKSIISLWSPRYILLREIKREFEDINHPRLYHNYDQLFDAYEKIFLGNSMQDQSYFIWLIKRVG